MSGLVSVGLIAVCFLVCAGVLFKSKLPFLRPILGVAYLIIGILCLCLFAYVSRDILNNGSPVTEITPGTYKVGFVYQAGGNVSIGIEKPKKSPYEKTEQLFLYQFPKKDFEGQIEPQAKKLTAYKLVTGDSAFNRYKLK